MLFSQLHPSDLGQEKIEGGEQPGWGFLLSTLCNEGPPSICAEHEMCKILNTDEEADIAKLGTGSGENPVTACSQGRWRLPGSCHRVPKCHINEISLIWSFFRGAGTLTYPRGLGLKAGLRMANWIWKDSVLNGNFWLPKESFLRLKLESENLGSIMILLLTFFMTLGKWCSWVSASQCDCED